MHEQWAFNYHTIELLNTEIPYQLLDKEHYWSEGTVPASFAKWFRELYGENEKPYILFFPIETGEENVCRYYATVDENWHYKVRLPAGEYRVAMTKFHHVSGPWGAWRVKQVLNGDGSARIKEKANLPEDFSARGFKAALARYAIVRKISKAMAGR